MALLLLSGGLVARPVAAPGSLSGLTFARAQVSGRSTALGADGATWAEYAADTPRFHGASQGLLIEGQRTNLIRNPRWDGAVAGSPGTAPTYMSGVGTSAGIMMSVAGLGTEYGLAYIDLSIAGTASGTAFPTLALEAAGTISATIGQSRRVAWFSRLVSGSWPSSNATLRIGGAEYNGSNAFLASMSAVSLSNPTSSLVRYSGDLTAANASCASIVPSHSVRIEAGTAITCTLRLYAPTCEAASFASTPILPPVGSPAAITRGADLVSAPLASLGIGANGACTVLWSSVVPNPAAYQNFVQIDDGSNSNRYVIRVENTTDAWLVRQTAGAVSGVLFGSVTAGAVFRAGMALPGDGTVRASLAGGAIISLTGGPTSGLTSFRVGSDSGGVANLFGEVRHLRVLPYAVPDAALRTLTAAMPLT